MTPRYESMPWRDLGPERLELTRVKPIRHDTDLWEEDSPRFLIVAPDDPRYRDLAFSVEEAIVGEVAGPARVLKPSEVSDAQRRTAHIIALGDIGNNALLLDLYHGYYVAVDHAYPGPGGHVLQTVYDPWGYGTNVIVCGGSDLAGVETAVARAREALRRQDGRVYWERLHDIVVSQQFAEQYPTVSFVCTEEHREFLVQRAYERIEQGDHRRAMPVLSHAGLMYNLTGDDRFAAAYRDVFKVVYQSASNDPGNGPWSPWGFDADFQSAPVLGAWDVVEECPLLSDEDRLYMTNHMLWYIQYMYEHARTHKPSKPAPRHNHYTFAALGLLFGAKYFGKYYDWPEAETWLREADDCFVRQSQAFKANEDCNSYQWLTFYHTLRYALLRPHPDFFESGMARQCMDVGIATMDNLGYQVPYGDVREYGGTFSEIPYYRAVSSLLKDPAYGPILDRKEEVRPKFVPGRSASAGFAPNGIQPVGYDYALELGTGRPLTRFLGVSILPVEPLYYEAFDGPEHMAAGSVFDKIVFRQSLDPADPYLLLDGLSNGGHLHYDGNAILRYTDKERIWLEDADYMKAPTKFHNTLLVFKDGKGEAIPPYMAFGEATWLAPLGYARSTARGYTGTDWTRHVLQVDKRFFLVMDQVVANEAGEYHLRCLWRGVGDAVLESGERRFTVCQSGPVMEIRSAPGHSSPVTLASKEEEMIWGSWENYPYHGATPDTKVLQERATRRMQPGDRYAFFNLVGVRGPYPRLVRLAEELVGLEGTGILAGTGRGLADCAGLDCDAAFFYVGETDLLLASVTHAALDGQSLLRSDAPISLRLADGMAEVQADRACTLTLDGEAFDVSAGRHALPGQWAEPLIGAMRREAGALAENAERDEGAVGEPDEARQEASPLWQLALPEGERPYTVHLRSDSAVLYVGTVEGTVHAVRDGQVAWSFATDGRVNSLAVDDVNGDGRAEIVVGSADFHVYLLDEDGQEIWRHRLPHYMHDQTVESVLSVDLGRGKAVMAGSNNCHVHALDPADGHEWWRYEVIHGVNDLTAADVNGDGVDEVLAVTEWWTWHAIDAGGCGLWKYWAVRPHYAPGANVARAGDIDGDGMPEMVVGSIDTCVYCFDRSGERVWEYYTGEEIAAVELVDVSGDGRLDVVAGSMNGYLYALDGHGSLLWQVNLHEEINSLTIVGEGAGACLAVGTDGRYAHVVGPDGGVLATLDTGMPLRSVAAHGDGSGLMMYAAGRDGRISAHRVALPLDP